MLRQPETTPNKQQLLSCVFPKIGQNMKKPKNQWNPYRFMSKQAAIGGPALGHDHGNKGLEIQNLASDFGNCVFQISPCISIFSYKKTFTNRSKTVRQSKITNGPPHLKRRIHSPPIHLTVDPMSAATHSLARSLVEVLQLIAINH